jgi:hypothetical protein
MRTHVIYDLTINDFRFSIKANLLIFKLNETTSL